MTPNVVKLVRIEPTPSGGLRNARAVKRAIAPLTLEQVTFELAGPNGLCRVVPLDIEELRIELPAMIAADDANAR